MWEKEGKGSELREGRVCSAGVVVMVTVSSQ